MSRTYTTPTTLPGGLLATVMRVAVHKPDQSADHGEGVTHVAIEDEGGGPFLLLEQPVPFDTREAGIAIDLAELEAVAIVARALINQPGLQDSEPGDAPDRPDHPEQALDMVPGGDRLTDSYLDVINPAEQTATREVLRQCIGLVMACEDVLRRDVANHIAQGLPDTIDHELRTTLVDSCAEWLPAARQSHQRLQADAQAMATLRQTAAAAQQPGGNAP